MKTLIRMHSIEDVETFLQIVCNYPHPIILSSDDKQVDGKSRIGIFSLNLSKPLEMYIANAQEKLLHALMPFILSTQNK